MKIRTLLCFFLLFLLTACSTYVGKAMTQQYCNDFGEFKKGYHLVEFDRIAIDYDWAITQDTSHINISGNYQLKADLASLSGTEHCQNTTIDFDILFLDENYTVLSNSYLHFMVDYSGHDDRREGAFSKTYTFHPKTKYLRWIGRVGYIGRCEPATSLRDSNLGLTIKQTLSKSSGLKGL